MTVSQTYRLLCDSGRHIVLYIGENGGKSYYISKDKKDVGVRHLPTGKFEDLYNLEYTEYPLADFAKRMLGLQDIGVTIAHRAKNHLVTLLHKEPEMAKPTAPVSTKAAPVAEPKGKAVKPTAAPAEAKTAKVKEPKAEGEARNRREKFDGSQKIKVIGKNTARVGSVRHSIVETILKARNVAEALDSTVQRKDGTDYKIGTPDIYFALETGLIELI